MAVQTPANEMIKKICAERAKWPLRKMVRLAADAIVEGLRRGDTSPTQLGCWIPEFQKGAAWIRKLVDAYYSPEFSFGHFLKDHPQYRGNLTDLLIGREPGVIVAPKLRSRMHFRTSVAPANPGFDLTRRSSSVFDPHCRAPSGTLY